VLTNLTGDVYGHAEPLHQFTICISHQMVCCLRLPAR